MKIKVYLESDDKITGILHIKDNFFKVNDDGWVSVPAEDWLGFKNGKMRIKKGAFLSFGEFKNLVYQDIKFPGCGAIDFENINDVEIEFDELKFDFYIEDKNTPHSYHGEIEISRGTIIRFPTIDHKRNFTSDNGQLISNDYDFFCFIPV